MKCINHCLRRHYRKQYHKVRKKESHSHSSHSRFLVKSLLLNFLFKSIQHTCPITNERHNNGFAMKTPASVVVAKIDVSCGDVACSERLEWLLLVIQMKLLTSKYVASIHSIPSKWNSRISEKRKEKKTYVKRTSGFNYLVLDLRDNTIHKTVLSLKKIIIKSWAIFENSALICGESN